MFVLVLLLPISSLAQVDSTTPPYLKFPGIPPIQLLLGDSITRYTRDDIPKKKSVLLMLFSPDCSHCQHETEELVANMDQLKEVTIIMATIESITKMNEFRKKNRLESYHNVIVGKDINYILPSFYLIRNFPYLALYNKKGHIIRGIDGAIGIPSVITLLKE